MRTFEYALTSEGNKMYEGAKIPEYATRDSAGADFFCAEDTIIPSIWNNEEGRKPTLVHTGIKARMGKGEVLYLYNRSSNPIKKGLVLANSVGVVDGDYYGNISNDGEIMFAFYNYSSEDLLVEKGQAIGQGVFEYYLRPEIGLNIHDRTRKGGYGSTDTTE